MKSLLKKTLTLACMSLFASGVLANEPMQGSSEEAKPAKHAKRAKHHKKECHYKCKKKHGHHHHKKAHKAHEENMEHGQGQTEGQPAH